MAAVLQARDEPRRLREAAAFATRDLRGEGAIPLLARIAEREGDDARVRFRAAACIIELLHGTIEDMAPLRALEEGVFDPDAALAGDSSTLMFRWEVYEQAANSVVRHGKTEAVRAAASEAIRAHQASGEFSTEPLKKAGERRAGKRESQPAGEGGAGSTKEK